MQQCLKIKERQGQKSEQLCEKSFGTYILMGGPSNFRIYSHVSKCIADLYHVCTS